jgi:hypothetical protein
MYFPRIGLINMRETLLMLSNFIDMEIQVHNYKGDLDELQSKLSVMVNIRSTGYMVDCYIRRVSYGDVLMNLQHLSRCGMVKA